MRLNKTGKADNHYYYVIEDYRTAEGYKKTRTVEALGCAREICDKYGVTDAELWCREYINKKNLELKESKLQHSRHMTVKLQENLPKGEKSCLFNAGYLILDSVYHSFGIANICSEIMKSHPHIKGFDLNNVLRTILFGRILFPSSKLALSAKYQQRFIEKFNIDIQHIYRAMDVLSSSNTIIQDRLFYYSSKDVKRNVNHIYYDCTNFYSEIETEDCLKKNKSDKWHEQHTLRKYGASKEHRPNPIVQMGLLMDGDGMPLSFCINPGNTNEQTTLIPLEENIFKNFKKADVVVCTDAGLSSEKNRKFNNKDADDPAVKMGITGQRHFICTQSVKKLGKLLEDWALEKSGWSYFTFDTETKQHRIVNNFNLELLENEELFNKHYNTVFFKERTTAENNLDSRMIVTFSLKYREYLRMLRLNKVNRAEKMIANGSYDRERDASPKSIIKTSFVDENGKEVKNKTVSINEEKISADEKYDGYYALTTDIFKEELPLRKVIAISARRWEIEECFRIMKTDLAARPFYHSKDDRIIAHFQTCFMALLLLRGVERKIADYHKDNQTFPDGKYTIEEILFALRNLNVFSIGKGQGYIPDYENSELISDLLNIFELQPLGNQVIMSDTLKNIIKKIKTSPAMYKIS